jgi:hypothetical protein
MFPIVAKFHALLRKSPYMKRLFHKFLFFAARALRKFMYAHRIYNSP